MKNVEKLNNTLQVELEELKRNERVGDFQPDLVGTDLNTGRKIVVENQLNKSDHSHLGKLLTYSAGLDVGIVVWIAEEFEKAHRSALEWLNNISEPKVSFFGIKPKVLKIENSPPAPKLDLVVEPDDWRKTIRAETEGDVSERDSQYRGFYKDLIDRLREEKPELTNIKSQPQSWIGWGAGKGGLEINWAFRRGHKFSVELFIDTGDGEENLRIMEEFKDEKEEIQEIVGDLSWEKLEDARACRIATYKQMPDDFMKLSDDQVEEIKGWGVRKMKEFQEVFPPRVRSLSMG